ncbi:hypothetical protein PYW07_005387 [Mythimna separata]|uniref:SET domain-containing protein n=1 Tax=Mythimna separata TaxID=271217 RepID=A0AAD7YEE3_MYTSE|nr:hypothetical protein PYW07_005387 [Mythimna separata]
MLQLSAIYEHYDGMNLDSVYKALRNKDLADCVLAATKALEQSNKWMEFEHKKKSELISLGHGSRGSKAFCDDEFQMSLENYNMALMRAPFDSEAMRLSYYARAGLFMKVKKYQACVKDVETCLALSCSDSMAQKLRDMKDIASNFIWVDELDNKHTQTSKAFSEEFFTLKGARNPDIPCATSHVEVNMESGKPKVVAARDIPVGTVVAVETAFIGAINMKNYLISCHYCHKMDLNLKPCDGCCSVMFCDNHCKDKAMQDGHNIECKIIDDIMIVDDIKLPVRATLKMRRLCSSWDEFITASYELGNDRMENSSIAEIFGSQKFALLNSHYDTHFIYGALLNRCLYLANIIHYLDVNTSFLPDSPIEKTAAIRALGRVMMHLALHCTPVKLKQYITLCAEGRTILHNYPNKGYFPFLGNLNNSCLPNAYVVGLRNSAALVTLAPVKKGAELTISYIGHWLEEVPTEKFMRAKKMFIHYRTVCKDCVICGGWADDIMLSSRLSNAQEKAFQKFMSYANTMVNLSKTIKSDYKETCKILLALSDAPCSKEYVKAFVSFVECIKHCVQFKFPNEIMSAYD